MKQHLVFESGGVNSPNCCRSMPRIEKAKMLSNGSCPMPAAAAVEEEEEEEEAEEVEEEEEEEEEEVAVACVCVCVCARARQLPIAPPRGGFNPCSLHACDSSLEFY